MCVVRPRVVPGTPSPALKTTVIALLVASIASPLAAQAEGVPFDDFRVAVHTAAPDLGAEYGIWAGGGHYKASFHDGMTFVPMLGRGYPRNLPVSWRTASVRRGERDLLERGEHPVPHGDGYRFEYRFAAFTEAYDVLHAGLEQTFVFETLPGNGDLVITGKVATELHADGMAPAHGALAFRDAQGNEVVRYGKAFAFDATGDRIELLTGYENGEITLSVPGTWLAKATLPVVVDPFFTSPVSVAGYLGDVPLEDVDVAHIDGVHGDDVLTVWSAAFSATDVDVFGRLTDEDFAGAVTVFTDMTTSWVTDHPAVAFVAGPDRWAIVFRRHFVNNPTTVSQLRAHVRDLGDLTQSSTYTSFVPSSGNDWRPDVGGVGQFSTGSHALVVFQRENNVGGFSNVAGSAVYGVRLDVTTTNGTFGTEFPIGASLVTDDERPSVNQVADGSPYSWMCVYQTYNNLLSSDDWDLAGKRISQTGTVASGTWTSDVAAASNEHQLRPVVEGGNGRWAVLFASYPTFFLSKTTSMAGTRMQLERFDWFEGSATPDPAGDQAPIVLEASATRVLQTLDLAFDRRDRSHFAPLWRESMGNGAYTPRYAIVGYTGQPTEGPADALAGLAQSGAVTFALGPDQYSVVTGSSTGSSAVLQGRPLEYNPPGPTALVGPGCSSVSPRWNGGRQIGSETDFIYVLSAPAGSGHFMLVSLAPENLQIIDPAVGSGCFLLVDNGPAYLGTMNFQLAPSQGFPRWTFPLPEWLPPLTLYFQDWVFDGTRFESTRRLEVPVIK